MNIALDTNAYSAIQQGNTPELKQLVEQAELIILPFIVDAELRAGFQKGARKSDNYSKLQRFQNLDRVLIHWPNDLTNDLHARIWVDLANKGKPIPTNDIWIAAVCLQHQLPIVTNDTHFSHVPLLQTLSY